MESSEQIHLKPVPVATLHCLDCANIHLTPEQHVNHVTVTLVSILRHALIYHGCLVCLALLL